MKNVAIVYHSGYGHTEMQAKRVHKGASLSGSVKADLFRIEDLIDDVSKLNEYDGIIFGSPTYMGSVSGPFKTFMDATSKVWFTGAWKDKIAAGFTNSNSMSGDKFNSLVQLVTLAAQHGMIWVSLGLANESSKVGQKNGDPECINRLGSYLGAMAQSDNLPADQTPPEGDLKTAEKLGERVAQAVLRWS